MRENIEVFHQFDPGIYNEILLTEYSARIHPAQPNSFLIDDPELPYYQPKFIEDHISILGFNGAPLSFLHIQAILDHPELFPDEVLIRWTLEQELILEKLVGELRQEQMLKDKHEGP